MHKAAELIALPESPFLQKLCNWLSSGLHCLRGNSSERCNSSFVPFSVTKVVIEAGEKI